MKHFRLFTVGVLIVSVLFVTGCLSAELPSETPAGQPEDSTSETLTFPPTAASTVPPSDVPTFPPSDVSTAPPTDMSAEPSSETHTDPSADPPTEPSLEPSVPEGKSIFFGRLTDEKVAAVNQRTLETQGSGLYDVLAPHTWLNEEVLPLVEAYTLPERPFYGARAVTPELREEILANRNTGYLSEFPGAPVQLRYGIISRNASVRSFPTSMRATDLMEGKTIDYFQESMFQIGEGVLVLHESLDGEWAFVQGPNYNGWVHEEDIAFTSEQTFRSFLTGRDFAVTVRPDVPVAAELPSGETYQRNLRLGTILPLKEWADKSVTLVFPVRNAVGDLETQEITLENNGAFSAGFMPYSTDALLRTARSVSGHEYGWGDEKENYDCSSFAGLTYRCFGIYLPRNSSQQRYFGGTVTDVSGQDRALKYSFLEQHPGAVLAYPGHVMLYEKTEDGRHYILHANTVWYDAGGALHEPYQVWGSALEELYRSDGSLLLDAVRWIVTFP